MVVHEHQAVFDCAVRETGKVVQVELGQQIGTVILGCFDAVLN
ncbi:MAG: hypothetical protein ACJAU9_001377 [Lentimonas sp.]|jgi:hypothetical protein